jgi:hypothetical protein
MVADDRIISNSLRSLLSMVRKSRRSRQHAFRSQIAGKSASSVQFLDSVRNTPPPIVPTLTRRAATAVVQRGSPRENRCAWSETHRANNRDDGDFEIVREEFEPNQCPTLLAPTACR